MTRRAALLATTSAWIMWPPIRLFGQTGGQLAQALGALSAAPSYPRLVP